MMNRNLNSGLTSAVLPPLLIANDVLAGWQQARILVFSLPKIPVICPSHFLAPTWFRHWY